MFVNCIVWANAGGSIDRDESSEPQVSYSCVEGMTTWEGEDNINTDPLFVQPGHWDDNGTPDDFSDDTWIAGDYHLQPRSPCIDAGTSEGAPTTDIEGNGRPCGAGVDMGAYEFGGCPPPNERFLRGDTNADSAIDIADAVFTLSYLFGDGPQPTCLDAADANDDGKINLADCISILNYLYGDDASLPAPFPACGIDPTLDDLDCAVSTCGE
jgi:hypothetical protein